MNDERLLLLLVYVVVSQFLVGTVVCQSSDEEIMPFTLSTMLFPSSVLFTPSLVMSSPSSMMASPSSMMTSSSSTMSSMMASPSLASSSSAMASPSSTMASPSSTMAFPSSTMASSSSTMASSLSMMASPSSMITSSSSTTISQSTTSLTILSSSNSQSLVLNETTPPSMVLTSSVSVSSTSSLVLSTSSLVLSTSSVSMSSNISSSTASTDVPLDTRSLMASNVLSSPSLSMTPAVYSASSSSSPQSMVSSSTRTITSLSTATPTPTDTPANILNFLQDIFEDTTILLVVAVGGPCILILLIVIIVFCCCFCCHQRRKGRYNVGREYNTRSGGDQVSSRRSISNPIPSYKVTLKNLQEERQRMDDFVETELGPDADDNIHYQGHSQVQHSQPYSPLSDVVGTQSLSKLTPFNPSQMISQAKGGISVDEIDEDIPQKDEHMNQRRSTLNNEGRDSPFMHLSDNLSGSRGRISQRSSSDPHTELIGTTTQPTQPSQASQYSHLGLGVLHGGDVVFTNTASLAEDMQSSLGMVGIDKTLLLSKDSDLHSYRTASPLLHDTSTDLDDTPVRESSAATLPSQSLKLKNLTSLTSLTSLEPTKLPRSSTPTKADSSSGGNIERSKKKLNLGSITALSTSSDDHVFTHSDVVTSDLQETPERHRRHTVESSTFKRYPGKSNQSKLGKLTSIEYIRASLRMKLNRIKRSDSNDSTSNKKRPLKSALRKTSSANSQNSSPDSTNSSRNNSFVYSNRHAHPYNGFSDVSPQHQHGGGNLHFHPPPPVDPYEYPPPMGGPDLYGSYNGMYPPPPGAVYPPRVPDPYMAVALSPPGYAPEPLSPILSVSQFDHPGMYPAHEIGILPQYGMPMSSAGYDQSFPPPHYDDDDDDDIPALHSPYRPGDQGGGASQSQRNVTWDLKPEEIPQRVEDLTPSDIDDDL